MDSEAMGTSYKILKGRMEESSGSQKPSWEGSLVISKMEGHGLATKKAMKGAPQKPKKCQNQQNKRWQVSLGIGVAFCQRTTGAL